jgi:hypothetical protein
MKTVREISVEIDNQPGTLAAVCELLTANGIAILGVSVHTNGDAGNVSLLVSDPDRTQQVLSAAGYAVGVDSVVAVQVPSHPGGFNTVLRVLKHAGINIDLLYTVMDSSMAPPASVLLLRVNDPSAAHEALEKEWISTLGEEGLM